MDRDRRRVDLFARATAVTLALGFAAPAWTAPAVPTDPNAVAIPAVTVPSHAPAAPSTDHPASAPMPSAAPLATPSPTSPVDLGAEVVVRALSLLGVGYRFGGNTPESGLDCSGLVRHVFRDALGLVLPRRSEEISRVGGAVPSADLQPGDLVFFNTLRRAFSHVGVYIGDNRFVHAPSSGGQIRVERLDGDYWVRRFDGARRVLARASGPGPAAALDAPTPVVAMQASSPDSHAGSAAPQPSRIAPALLRAGARSLASPSRLGQRPRQVHAPTVRSASAARSVAVVAASTGSRPAALRRVR